MILSISSFVNHALTIIVAGCKTACSDISGCDVISFDAAGSDTAVCDTDIPDDFTHTFIKASD